MLAFLLVSVFVLFTDAHSRNFTPITIQTTSAPSIRLSVIGTYRNNSFNTNAAEIAAHDPGTQRLFIVNGDKLAIDVLDIHNPYHPRFLFAIDVSSFGAPTSVAVKRGRVAVAVLNVLEPAGSGSVVFFDVHGTQRNAIRVGAVPDMVTFTPDGRYVLVAIEGEPLDYLENTPDPEGGVGIIDISQGVRKATLVTADFKAFHKEDLIAKGVRIYGPDASAAQDLEPEYIAVSRDAKTAWVTLQENNALAIVDIQNSQVTAVLPLGLKDYSLPGNGLDASDIDDAINIRPWPVFGMYQPDAIAAYQIEGKYYLVTANEGDSRDKDGFSEEARIGDEEIILDADAFPGADALKEETNLGRLKITTVNGDVDDDGDFDELWAYGGRSFSIWSAETGELLFDSADQFEQITRLAAPEGFNSQDDQNEFDSRSDDKGPEPEGITVGKIDGRVYAFILLERTGGIMIYDVTDPHRGRFVQYINNRNFDGDPEAGTGGDLGPEGVLFIPQGKSPIDHPLLVVANETSDSMTLYRIDSDRLRHR
jgi:DNA-binding beta-propeller fold protein YncE